MSDWACGTQGGAQSALIDGDKSRPGETVRIGLEPESPEPLVEEIRRRLERMHVAQPATGACEPREGVERGEQLASKFEANRDGRYAVGMKCDDALIVEVENPNPVARTNGRAVGQVESSMAVSDFDANHRPDLRRRGVKAMKKPVRSVVGGD